MRRKGRRGRRTTTYTTQSGTGSSSNYRGRRMSGRKYRSILWRDTIMKQHYRSIGSKFTATATPNNVTQCTVVTFGALDNGVAQFWETAGGATGVDAGVAVPIFGSTIILRGGVARLAISSSSTDDPVRVRIWAVWTTANPSLIPANGTYPLDWDPSTIPTPQREFGKILFNKEAMLLGGNTVTCTYRHKVQKIDKEEFQNGGRRLIWVYSVAQLNNTEAILAPESVTAVASFNLSFSADETT